MLMFHKNQATWCASKYWLGMTTMFTECLLTPWFWRPYTIEIDNSKHVINSLLKSHPCIIIIHSFTALNMHDQSNKKYRRLIYSTFLFTMYINMCFQPVDKIISTAYSCSVLKVVKSNYNTNVGYLSSLYRFLVHACIFYA